MGTMNQCDRCGTELVYDIELDTGVCESCADALIERDRERREWEYYHPADEPFEPDMGA